MDTFLHCINVPDTSTVGPVRSVGAKLYTVVPYTSLLSHKQDSATNQDILPFYITSNN